MIKIKAVSQIIKSIILFISGTLTVNQCPWPADTDIQCWQILTMTLWLFYSTSHDQFSYHSFSWLYCIPTVWLPTPLSHTSITNVVTKYLWTDQDMVKVTPLFITKWFYIYCIFRCTLERDKEHSVLNYDICTQHSVIKVINVLSM